MKTEKNILVAFILNITFSIFELLGGLFTNSVSIISDSIHDFGDALSIGVSYILEKISKRKPNEVYTYGYVRYSILGSMLTTLILFVGSIIVIIGSIFRLLNPIPVKYNGMILIALVGVVINFIAAFFTRKGNSLNQKSVNLHMLEDVLGWVVVLIGSILIKITDISVIDPIMSIIVALFILTNAFNNFIDILNIILEKTTKNIDVSKLKKSISNIKEIEEFHHLHIWSMDGLFKFCNCTYCYK